MQHPIRRLTSAVTAIALTLALAPAAALASPRTEREARYDAKRAGARLLPQGFRTLAVPEFAPDTWAQDLYDDGDDTPAGARDLTPWVAGANPPAGFGKASHDETRTFYVATNESAVNEGDYEADADWAYFDVAQFDVDMGKPYLLEAQAGNLWVDPVIEVYGPTTTDTIAPGDPAANVDPSGVGVPDAAAVAASDNGFWWAPSGLSSSVTFSPDEPGRYFVRVRPYFDATGHEEDPQFEAGYNVYTGAGPYTLKIKAGQMTRLAGLDRIQTAIALSKERYADGELPLFDWSGGGGTVVIASGYNFPDALAGSTLAGAVGGPLLLSHPTYLDQAVKDELVRLGAQRVFLLGGTKTLASAVESAAADVEGVLEVQRIAGDNRVLTAAAIGQQAADEWGGTAPLAFVANGWSFPDALAASPMAAYNVAPILLTHQAYLDGATLAAIQDLGVTDVVVLGSKDAVSDAVFADLVDELGAGHVQRIGGANRYDTAKQFAVWATGSQGATDVVGTPAMDEESKLWALYPDAFAVAAGWNYPDALGGGTFAGQAGYPILLNPRGNNVSPYILDIQNQLAPGSAYLDMSDPDSDAYIGKIGRSYIIGGSTTLGDGVWGGLDALLQQTIQPES